MGNENASIKMESHSWKTARDLIRRIRPDFAKVIDDVNPDDQHTLKLVRYPYGSLPLDKGIFQLPNSEGSLVPINHSSITTKIKEDYGYTKTIPMGLVVKNGFESFTQSKSRILPGSLVGVGNFLSLWRIFEEKITFFIGPFWSVTAGARSLCMLPKITDSIGYKNLKTKYGLKLSIPQQLSEHWDIFKHIANHSEFTQPWTADIIFFSKQWFEHKADKKWSDFYRFLLNEVWQTSFFRRNLFIFDAAFSIAIENKNLKPNPYLADTVKHLIALGSGDSLCFSPAINDVSAPISGLQKAFLEIYGLKKYPPVIMQPYHFSREINRIGYYSFQIPNTTIFSPKARKLSSTMFEMRELKHIMESVMSEILKGHLGVEQTVLFDIAKNVRYDYFHCDKDKDGEILSAGKIQQLDPRLSKTIIDKNDYLFSEFSPFFRGCIAISNTV